MKLVCLWVNNYKCLHNELVVFSPHYKVTNNLTIKQSVPPPSVYEEIEDITAFVGKNGVGKTSLIEVLLILLGGEEDKLEAVLIIEVDTKLYFVGHQNVFSLDGTEIPRLKRSKEEVLTRNKTIFYSPVYNPHSSFPEINKKFVQNVSSDSEYAFAREKNKEVDIRKQFSFFESMDEFARESLGFDRHLEIDIKYPDVSGLKRKLFRVLFDEIDRDEYELLERSFFQLKNSLNFTSSFMSLFKKRKDAPEEYYNEINELKKYLNDAYEYASEKIYHDFLESNVEFQIKFLLFLEYINSRYSSGIAKSRKGRSNNLWLMTDIVVRIFTAKSAEEWFLESLKILEVESKFHEYMSDANKINNIVRSYQRRNSCLPLSFSPSQADAALGLLSSLRKEKLMKYNIKVNWKGVSSGQVAKMNLYARIFDSLSDPAIDHAILLLDEADIYLHPEWQRSFILELSNFFKAFKAKFGFLKSVSLVLTTHSPLMISDLFKEDVYIISEGIESGRIKMAEKDTFGANIYQLYREEFVTNNPKGEIANRSINSMLHGFKFPEQITSDRRADLLLILDKIGDPVIKNGLKNLSGCK